MIADLVRKSTILGEYLLIEKCIQDFYRFPIFRSILNLTFSLIEEMRLFFKIYDNRLSFHDGLCQTIPLTDQVNQYIILIWKNDPYILIHEISHMVEKETKLDLYLDFLPIIHKDLQNLNKTNILIQELVKQVIFKEIKLYQNSDLKASELFARFFELFAWSQELYPKERNYRVHMKDLKKFFIHTYEWVFEFLDPIINKKVHPYIKEYSFKINFSNSITDERKWANKIDKKTLKFDPKT